MMIENRKTLHLIHKSKANYNYFFKILTSRQDASWLRWLVDNGFFAEPPSATTTSNKGIFSVIWWPMRYLASVAEKAPDEVTEVITQLKVTNNPNISSELMEIALKLKGGYSLKNKIFAYLKASGNLLGDTVQARILARWVADNMLDDALEFSQVLAQNVENICFDDWQCHQLLNDGLLPLINKRPLEVAKMLAVTLQPRPSIAFDSCQQDFSDRDVVTFTETLEQALVIACEDVYRQNLSTKIDELDDVLRNRPEMFFVNLRQYLYTKYPNKKTKDLIRELIISDQRYGVTPYDREFFQLIKTSCECFTDNLLSIAEREKIFSKIMVGVVEEGNFYTSKDLHRTQLFPFAKVLFGKYKIYFEALIGDYDKNHSHLIYHYPEKVADHIFDYSPFSPQQLARYGDIELLALVNSWQNEFTVNKDDCLIRISIVGLSKVFADTFKEHVVCNDNRLSFWLTEGKKITRPIYVQEMLAVACRGIEQQTLDDWLSFCKWVLSHQESRDPKAKNTSSVKPDWYGARVFVHKLIESIAKKEAALFKGSKQLEEILFLLCTQPDKYLDVTKTSDNDRQFDLGMRFARSRSLLTLMKFAENDNFYLKVMLKVFEKRFAECNISAPEQAILGYMFPLLVALDEKIAEQYRRKIFPPDEHNLWCAAFEGLIGYHKPSELIYTTVCNEFKHYVEHLQGLRKKNHNIYLLEDTVTDLFFNFYMQGKFSLHGEESLLAQYYQATDNDRDGWGGLFSRVGRSSQHSNPSKEQKNKVIGFLWWRIKQKDAQELSNFSSWLDVSWLDDKIFMLMAKEILQLIEFDDVVVVNAWLRKFCALLPSLVTDVVDCSWLLIKNLTEDMACYLHIEHVQAIISAGEAFEGRDTRMTTQKIKAFLIKRAGLNIDDLSIGVSSD